jgi:hypothetical protein
MVKKGDFAFGAFFLIFGLIGLWIFLPPFLHYNTPIGQIALGLSEAARKNYETAQFYSTVASASMLVGALLCIYAIVSEPRPVRICPKCGRVLSSFPSEIKLCPFCGNQLD